MINIALSAYFITEPAYFMTDQEMFYETNHVYISLVLTPWVTGFWLTLP